MSSPVISCVIEELISNILDTVSALHFLMMEAETISETHSKLALPTAREYIIAFGRYSHTFYNGPIVQVSVQLEVSQHGPMQGFSTEGPGVTFTRSSRLAGRNIINDSTLKLDL
jgi:hypothetical protein